jgi:poly(hydroxyalkanoate) granule-associated protein
MADTSTKTQDKNKNPFEEMQKELADRGRDVWLAGLGALATVEEEGSKLFARLVERGKEYEDLSAKQVKALTDRVAKQQEKAVERAEETTTAAQSAVANTVDKALERFGVPTRSEVSELSKKVDKLSKQIDTLSKNIEKEAK